MTLILLKIIIPPFSDTKYWSDVIENGIGCAIGSAIAIVVSLFIYWLTIRQTEKSTRRAIELMEENQLKAFTLMIKDAINFTERQSANTKIFIDQLKKHPNIFPLLHMQPLGTLTRVIDTITVEKTGMTYMKRYPSKNSAKEFISILDAVDYLYYGYWGLKDQLAKASNNHIEWAYKISDYFDIADKLIRDYFADAPKEDVIANGIWAIKHEFLAKRKDRSDLHYVYLYYFLPLSEYTNGLINVPKPSQFVVDLHYNLGKGIERYTYWKNGYDLFIDEMTEVQGDIDKSLGNLKNEAAKILSLNVQ